MLKGGGSKDQEKVTLALAGWLGWLEHCPNVPGSRVQFPVRAQTRSNQ